MSLDDDGIWLRNLCEHADKTLCKCGIHDSCVDCHHENTSDDDERTCIQKLHDDFHAAEIDKLVAQRARYEFEADFARCRAALAEAEARARVAEAERDALLAEHEAGVCPVCHMRSTSGYYRDEHGLGHVCTHAYHAAYDNAERVRNG